YLQCAAIVRGSPLARAEGGGGSPPVNKQYLAHEAGKSLRVLTSIVHSPDWSMEQGRRRDHGRGQRNLSHIRQLPPDIKAPPPVRRWDRDVCRQARRRILSRDLRRHSPHRG